MEHHTHTHTHSLTFRDASDIVSVSTDHRTPRATQTGMRDKEMKTVAKSHGLSRSGVPSCTFLYPLDRVLHHELAPRLKGKTVPHVHVDVESSAHAHIGLVGAGRSVQERLRPCGVDEGVFRCMNGQGMLSSSLRAPRS